MGQSVLADPFIVFLRHLGGFDRSSYRCIFTAFLPFSHFVLFFDGVLAAPWFSFCVLISFTDLIGLVITDLWVALHLRFSAFSSFSSCAALLLFSLAYYYYTGVALKGIKFHCVHIARLQIIAYVFLANLIGVFLWLVFVCAAVVDITAVCRCFLSSFCYTICKWLSFLLCL